MGKRLGLVIRNEYVNPIYATSFMNALFEEEGGDLLEVRQAILGHLQQGGDPSPFDHTQATRLAARCVTFLVDRAAASEADAAFIGLQEGRVHLHDIDAFPRMVDRKLQQPNEQWWLHLRPIARILAQPAPRVDPVLAALQGRYNLRGEAGLKC